MSRTRARMLDYDRRQAKALTANLPQLAARNPWRRLTVAKMVCNAIGNREPSGKYSVY